MENQNKAYVVVLPAMNGDPEEFVFIEEDDDLSHWEFVHSDDSDAGAVESRGLLFSSPTAVAIPDMIPDVDDRGFDYEPSDDVYGEPYIYDQDDDDDGDDDGYGCDLDDELVPRDLAGKFGRQRMRKLGKRAFAKMNNSKRSPFLYVKPGCVHGKHGLGLKHCF
ncbi:uncharacterized protein LOC120209331 [Hibiscus syriacus]|uniref:uncharacterized protein LOC120209331 n=1 Tax=Hibiscus syriacus TaxID=106335 RepID=UPI0019239EFB|nr:uncharacterized protein LOC120209331 [Hibiscus syriacus]